MKKLLIVYHSLTGGTAAMAEAAAAGARVEDSVATMLMMASSASGADLLAADGVMFATPENLAAMSGLLKDFFDRSYYTVLGRIEGRPYATLICAGSDGRNAAAQVARIATGWRLRPVADPVIVCTHAQTPDAILQPKVIPENELQRCRDLGAAMAAGLSMGIF
jgi:multimeric flavodoxin WrbA